MLAQEVLKPVGDLRELFLSVLLGLLLVLVPFFFVKRVDSPAEIALHRHSILGVLS